MPHSTIMDDNDRVFLDLKCLQMATIIRLAAQSSVISCGTVFLLLLSLLSISYFGWLDLLLACGKCE